MIKPNRLTPVIWALGLSLLFGLLSVKLGHADLSYWHLANAVLFFGLWLLQVAARPKRRQGD